MQQVYYIYKLTNIVNGKAYIGFTGNPERRWRKHELHRTETGEKALYRAIEKYGWGNFTRELLYCSLDGEHTLRVMEPYFIQYYKTRAKNGYNLTDGGEGILGYRFGLSARQKMSESHRGERNAFFHKTHDAATRLRMSTIAKQRPTRTGLATPNYGKVRSEETNEQVRQKVSKKWLVTGSDGIETEVFNLKAFCKDRSLSYIRMLEIVSGKQKQHRGYTVKRLGDSTQNRSEETKTSVRLSRGGRFLMTHPDGHTEEVIGMKHFCRQHNLSASVMFFVADGKYKQHKGFLCRRLNNFDQEFSDFLKTIGNPPCTLISSASEDDTRFQVLKYEWIDKPEIVKDRLRYKFSKETIRLHGRKCKVVEVENGETKAFLDLYHIQGSSPSKVRLGLCFEGELVSVMTFGTPRFNKRYQYELIRFATKAGVRITGGASKLFAAFIENHRPDSVISYANLRWNTGGVYEKIGMLRTRESGVNYFYMKDGKRFSRMHFQKHKLQSALEIFDPMKTERENLLANGYEVIYDAPNAVYVWNRLTTSEIAVE